MALIRRADVSLEFVDGTAQVRREGRAVGVLAEPGLRVAAVWQLLTDPHDEDWLRTRLASEFGVDGAMLVDALLVAGVIERWPLGDELAALHAQTVSMTGGTARPASDDDGFIEREYGGDRGCELARAGQLGISLSEALLARRSQHALAGPAIPVEAISDLLGWAAGSGTRPALPALANGVPASRTYPSGGALYPVETYLIASSVENVAPAIYRYQPLGHRLAWHAPAPTRDALALWLIDEGVDAAAGLVMLAVDFARASFARYGLKEYRLALLEAGHVGQNIVLVSAALQLNALPICGFDDQALSVLARLNYPRQAVVYVVALGTGGTSAHA
jgi:SagB-type dehydrogenase family enzyme